MEPLNHCYAVVAPAQVTSQIGDNTTLTVQKGGKSSFCTPKKLVSAVVTVIAIIIIIIITAVIISVILIVTKNNESDQVVPSIPTLASSVDPEMTPTQPPTMKATTTFGPAVLGNFEGTFVMDRAYGTYFDDARAPATAAFMTNFTGAMDEVYHATIAEKYLYVETLVIQLVQNGTYVQVRFIVELNAINRGGSDYLVNTLGSFPSNALNTYDVLYADIGPEIDHSTGA